MKQVQNSTKRRTFEGRRLYLEDVKKIENIFTGSGLISLYKDGEHEYDSIDDLCEHNSKRIKKLIIVAKAAADGLHSSDVVTIEFDGSRTCLTGNITLLQAYEAVCGYLAKKENVLYDFLNSGLLLFLGVGTFAISFLLSIVFSSSGAANDSLGGVLQNLSLFMFFIAFVSVLYRSYYCSVILDNSDDHGFLRRHLEGIISAVLTALIVALLHKYFGVLGC